MAELVPAVRRTRADLAAAVAGLLDRESHNNERQVAIVRVLTFSTVAVLDVGLTLWGFRDLRDVASSAACAAAAGLSLLLLQGERKRGMRFAMPLLDFALIAPCSRTG